MTRELDLLFDDITFPEAEAIEKMIPMLQEAGIDPKDWVRLTAFAVASWEFPSVRETLAEPMPTESPDTLTTEDLRHRQDVCLDPPGDQP
jgi:hypothetical protein